ncbi:AraC family transcriptional regulator [Paenibacillus selenitireducens]|uniref:AraC family transcriptional regulator n=1 Tax=Paenibacillus selenitireducens TaxID=1324314 RepID=A0A1T2X645_9BACL|nr:GyrI-like domain-containing protein [Paenibacillus selenitireducens]OPA75358.1 AraC family transcriptional regulator [Paenibacillus selenitireducens]
MKVVELNEMKLVGLRVVCPGDQYVNEIPKASLVLKERLNEINDVVRPIRLIGAFFVGDFSEEEDGYWVCVEVNTSIQIPEGMVSVVVPKQKYAVIRHNGSYSDIRNTYEKLHHWIEENKLERLQKSWHLEISDEWGHKEINNIEVDLYDTIK